MEEEEGGILCVEEERGMCARRIEEGERRRMSPDIDEHGRTLSFSLLHFESLGKNCFLGRLSTESGTVNVVPVSPDMLNTHHSCII